MELIPLWAKWLGFAVLLAGAYAAGDLRRANQDKLEAAAAQLEITQEARRFEQKRASGVQEAQDHAQAIARASRADAAAAHTELDRLRDTIAARDRAASTPSAECRIDAAAAERELFGACATALQGMAEEADAERAHLIELQGYVRAITQDK